MSDDQSSEKAISPRLRPQEVNEEQLRAERMHDWAHYGDKFGTKMPLLFELPRKTCAQIIPEISRLFEVEKKPKKKAEDVDDDDSEFSEETPLPPQVQHRLHILKKIMKRARISQVDRKLELIKDLDKAERTVPWGQRSKNLYEDIFVRRDFDMYGRFVDYQRSQPPRKYAEMEYWAQRFNIEYTQIKDMTLVDESHISVSEQKLREEKDQMAEEADRKRDAAILNAKPLITTAQWKLDRMKLHHAPVGFAQNPSQPVHSLGNEQFFSYDGEWKMGRMTGTGRYKFNDTFEYNGLWKNNKQHGKGEATYPGGQLYTGEWERGRYWGKGEFTSVCGSKYIGHHEFGRRHGIGKLTFESGQCYEGEFMDGRPHGRGVMTSKLTGWSYEGSFHRGFIQGSGVLITPPPQNKHIVQFWPESDNDDDDGLQLPHLVRQFLQEKNDMIQTKERERAETYGVLRGNQLKSYVAGIRSKMYNERLNIKKVKFNEAMRLAKEAKQKLYETRMKALVGEDINDVATSASTKADNNITAATKINGSLDAATKDDGSVMSGTTISTKETKEEENTTESSSLM